MYVAIHKFDDYVNMDIPEKTKDVIHRAMNVYDRCARYSGRRIHEVNSCAGWMLNGVANVVGYYELEKSKYSDEQWKEIQELKADCEKQLEEFVEKALETVGPDLP